MLRSESISASLFKILPMPKRVDLAKSPDIGGSLLSALTPTEYSELFPKYYQRGLPDVEGFQLAVTKRTRQQQQEADADLQQRIAQVESTNAELSQGMERLGVTRKGAAPPPKLSEEQNAAYSAVQSGDIPVGSDQGKTFSDLTNEQLASVGISKIKNEKGEDVYHYTAAVTGREEAVSRLKAGGGDIDKVMASIRKIESGSFTGNYTAHASTSSASGAYQFVKGTWQEATRRLGIGTEYSEAYMAPKEIQDAVARAEMQRIIKQHGIEKLTNVWFVGNASGIMTAKQQAANPGVTADTYRNKFFGNLSTLGASKEYSSETKPEGPGGQYSDKQIADMMQQLSKEKDVARRQQLANLLSSQGVQVPPGATSAGAARAPGSMVGGFYGSNEQCAALSKHFAPQIGPASGWKINYDASGAGIRPGSVIATTSYNDGSGGKMARSMPDHRSHYHTGVALTTPDAQGNVLILDQSVGRQAQIHRVNIHNYNGEKWGLVPNGGPTPRSMQAVHMAMGSANESEKQAIGDALAGKAPTAQSTTSVQEPRPVTEATNVVPKTTQKQDVSVPQTAPQPEQQTNETTKTAVVEKKPEATPAKAPTADPSKPAEPSARSFSLNREGLISAIRQTDEFKNTFGSSFATDDMIYEGFFNDARTKKLMRETGSTYDPSTGTVKIGDYKKFQESIPDMNTSKFLKPLKGSATGGNFNVPDGGLIAYRATGGTDNTLVVDKNQKPLFTMNDNETATFDPSQNKVKVDPTIKAKGNMRGQQPSQSVDNTDVMSSIESLRNEMVSRMETAPQRNPLAANPRESQNVNMINHLQDMTRTPFLNPAMERAVSRVGGVETSGTPGVGSKHFNFGNKNG